MLEQFDLVNAHPVRTPFCSSHVIDRNPHDGKPPADKPALVKAYQSLVGGLNWISLSTHPDLTAPVCLLATYLHNPSQGHLWTVPNMCSGMSKAPWAGASASPSHQPPLPTMTSTPRTASTPWWPGPLTQSLASPPWPAWTPTPIATGDPRMPPGPQAQTWRDLPGC